MRTTIKARNISFRSGLVSFSCSLPSLTVAATKRNQLLTQHKRGADLSPKMMSEDMDAAVTATSANGGGGAEPFELVNNPVTSVGLQQAAPADSAVSAMPPPAPLPDFATLSSSMPPSDPPSTQPPPCAVGGPPPPVGPPGVTAGANPFSIRASSGGAHGHSHHTAPPPPVFNTPAPPLPPTSGAFAAPPNAGTGASLAFEIPDAPSAPAGEYTSPLSAASHPGDPVSAEADSSQVWGWLKSTVQGSELLSKVAEKAKSSVDTMITTLDPQMKDYIASSGVIELAVASDKEVKISAVKQGFRRVFKEVMARGLGSPGVGGLSATLAAQPVGFANGKQAVVDRISSLRQSGLVSADTPIVATEGFLVETEPDTYFEMACVAIDDSARGIFLHGYSQPSHVPSKAVENLKRHTPSDYALSASGFAVTVGQAVAECLGVAPDDWHYTVGGVHRTQLLADAAVALAHRYKHALGGVLGQESGGMDVGVDVSVGMPGAE